MNKGGNSKRQINVSSILPKYAFDKYIYNKRGTNYGNKILTFQGKSVITTSTNNSHCPYKFAAWFFNNSTSTPIVLVAVLPTVLDAILPIVPDTGCVSCDDD